MRVLVLCELFPLVQGTRGRQMAKVADALEQHAARSGKQEDLLLVSGFDPGRESEAEAWVAQSPATRAAIGYHVLSGGSGVLEGAARGLGYVIGKATNDSPFVHRALGAVRDVIERFAPDVMMTVAVPLVWHRVGLEIHRQYPPLKWLAYFSDPRPLALLPPPFRRYRLSTYFKKQFCREVFTRADGVIAPNVYMLDWMEETLRVPLEGRRHIIPHCGTRASDAIRVSEDFSRRLVYAGSLFEHQLSWELLKAIRDTARRHAGDFRGLSCVGHVPARFPQMLRLLDMERTVEVREPVSPEDAVAIIASAGANLITESPLECGYFLHSKFADYAVNGRPILTVGPRRCPMRDYLEAYGGGLAVGHRQEEIENALKQIFVMRDTSPSLRSTLDLASQFCSESVAARYFSTFAHCANRHRIDATRQTWHASAKIA